MAIFPTPRLVLTEDDSLKTHSVASMCSSTDAGRHTLKTNFKKIIQSLHPGEKKAKKTHHQIFLIKSLKKIDKFCFTETIDPFVLLGFQTINQQSDE